MTITHKHGDSFQVNATYSDAEGVPIDLTGYTIRSQVRTGRDTLVEELVPTVVLASAGTYKLVSAGTSSWPIALLNWDIQYTIAGVIISTDTMTIDVVQDITHDTTQ